MFTSYAQNFEDVILWRALKHIENGFYIDVGAQDPLVHSVSRGFYELGWRGIHAEATSNYASKLRTDRPDEGVVEAAIGAKGTSVRFFEIVGTGLSTADESIAKTHEDRGFGVVETTVASMPLSTLLDRANGNDIHWLKIDVEGMEGDVLASWRPSRARPWIVVVESTAPLSQAETHALWEDNLLSLGYQFVYFDGLNRFYVSEQHPELIPFFGLGPNVFDEFVLAEHAPYSAGLRSLLAERDNQWRILQEELSDSRNQVADAQEKLYQTYQSLSWRLTRPLREVSAYLKRARALPRQRTGALLETAIRWLSRHPRWKDRSLQLLRYFPWMRNRLEAFANARGYAARQDHDVEGRWNVDAPKGSVAKWERLTQNRNTGKG
jgi:FkbM family methyltransferase